MRLVRLAHRWTGGLIGLLLFVLGLTGTVLVFKDDWLRAVVPHAAEARVSDPRLIGAALDQAFSAPDRPRSVILADDRLSDLLRALTREAARRCRQVRPWLLRTVDDK